MYSSVLALIDNPDLTFVCDSPIYILYSLYSFSESAFILFLVKFLISLCDFFHFLLVFASTTNV